MVMASEAPQGLRMVPRFTLEVCEGMTIAQAIANADALGGDWTILAHPGRYDEIDITPNGGANITIKAMGEGRVVIWPTGDPVAAVIVSAHTLNLEDVDVFAFSAGFPALRVTGGTFEATGSIIEGVGAGDAVQQVGGTVLLHDSQVPVGDIDLSTGACTLTLTDCNINGTLDTAGAVIHTVTIRHGDFNDQAFNLAATGACVYHFESCNHIGTITDASLGAGVVNGHLCRSHVTVGGLVKNGTTGWLVDNSELTNISNADATGVISVYGGIVLACGIATGVTLWYKAPSLMWVLPSGATDHINIQAALDALPATGGEVFLLEGTYYVEASIVPDSYQTLRGCGRNTIITTGNAINMLEAIGTLGNEIVGIVIEDLCIDGADTCDNPIYWDYVEYSAIRHCWIRNSISNEIWFESNCKHNQFIGNSCYNMYGIYLSGADNTHNIFAYNEFLDCNSSIYLDGVVGHGSDYCTVVGNTLDGNVGGGISTYNSKHVTITGNSIRGMGAGITVSESYGVAVVGNSVGENGYGIWADHAFHCNFIGNTVCLNDEEGIKVGLSVDCLISNNNVYGNSQKADNTDANILLTNSNRNSILDNLCRAPIIGTTLTVGEPIAEAEIAVTNVAGFEVGMGVVIDLGGVNEEYHRIIAVTGGAPGVITIDAGLTNAQGAGETIDVPRASYGIDIQAGCNENTVKGNDLYNSGKTALFNDAGTDTHLAAYVVPFSHGSDPQDSGFEIDVAAEFALAWLRLPVEVQQVVRMKIYARSVVLEADAMRLEINVNGGADNEAFNTHATAAPDTPSTSTNFVADDIIFWTLVAAEILALVGGDSVEVKVLHEDAGNGDCQTDAFFRTVEFEYV